LEINFYTINVEKVIISKKGIKETIYTVIRNEGKKIGNINIIFTDNKKILEINKRFLNHHYYTDVIAFNCGRKNIISGDIFISNEQVIKNANEFKTTIAKEIIRVIIHGILHLIGYNDKEANDLSIMTSKEDMYLSKVFKVLKKANEKQV
jgi:probable rRNA maturation factor